MIYFLLINVLFITLRKKKIECTTIFLKQQNTFYNQLRLMYIIMAFFLKNKTFTGCLKSLMIISPKRMEQNVQNKSLLINTNLLI